MKTTLELPDGLLQRIKLRAVHRRRKLKDEIASLLEAGLSQAPAAETPRKAPNPVRLRGRPPTIEEIEAAIHAGRDSSRRVVVVGNGQRCHTRRAKSG